MSFQDLKPQLDSPDLDSSILDYEDSDDINNGDVAMIMSVGGLAQGVSFLLG